MWADQAIFTSLCRQGRSGYHVVARSPGLTVAELTAMATWLPSDGALQRDAANPVGVSGFVLPSGRYLLARTCLGAAEYSGRGTRQVYTHALLVDAETLTNASNHPVALYRAALAQGLLLFQADPPSTLERVCLPAVYADRDRRGWLDEARRRGLPALEPLLEQIALERSFRVPYAGDRLALAECVLGALTPAARPRVPFTTSLVPSSARPVRMAFVPETH